MKKVPDEKVLSNQKKIEGFLSPKSRMGLKIESVIGALEPNFNLLLLVNQDNYSLLILPLLRAFSKQKDRGIIFVAVNKPFEKIKAELLKGDFPLQNIRFIDMVSSMVGAKKVEDKCVFYLPATSSLNDLIEAIQHELEEKKQKNVVLVFDSVSTLLVYNDALPVEKMVHSLIGKLGKFSVDGVFVMAKSKEFAGPVQTISQFCDKVVEIEKL